MLQVHLLSTSHAPRLKCSRSCLTGQRRRLKTTGVQPDAHSPVMWASKGLPVLYATVTATLRKGQHAVHCDGARRGQGLLAVADVGADDEVVAARAGQPP